MLLFGSPKHFQKALLLCPQFTLEWRATEGPLAWRFSVFWPSEFLPKTSDGYVCVLSLISDSA